MKTSITYAVYIGALACLLTLSGNVFSQGGAIFTAGPLMNSTRIYPVMATLNDGKVIAFGGRAAGFIPSSYADIYDPVTNAFTQVAMNFPHDNSPVVKLFDGRYYIIGGATAAGVPAYSSCELYDPAANAFIPAGSLAYARMWASAAQLVNGHVLIVGAWYDPAAASIAEYYDTTSHAYTATNPLTTGRAYPVVLPTDDGGAMVCGGGNTYGGSEVHSVEYYNPGDNSFHLVSSQLIPADSGWEVNGTPYHNRPCSDYRMSSGKYLLLGSRNVSTYEYGLITFDPATKIFTTIPTTTPIMDALTDGGFYDIVLNRAANIAYLLGVDAGSAPSGLSLVAVDLTTGAVYHPGTTFSMPPGEYLFPQMAFMPTVNKILLEGISSTSGDYYHATDKSYIITPQDRLGLQDMKTDRMVSIGIYPNPATSDLYIVIPETEQSVLDVKVYDIVGNQMLTNRSNAAGGRITLDISCLPAGIYFVEVKGNSVTRGKFIKQ